MKTKYPIMLTLFLVMFAATTVHAWDNCPFGEVNESYPGTCGRYTDSDGDGICDLSQPAPGDRTTSNEANDNNAAGATTDAETNIQSNNARINYFFIPIALVLFLFYLATYLLAKKEKIRKVQHKKIWNILLLITFLVSGIFGIVLAILISYGIRLSFYADLLFWHVEFGIAMAVISIFHLAWHWKYYKKMIMKKN